jgi:hypothetical protein
VTDGQLFGPLQLKPLLQLVIQLLSNKLLKKHTYNQHLLAFMILSNGLLNHLLLTTQ